MVVVNDTHTPVTDRKEVMVYWPTVGRVCGLCDVLDDPSSCFDFEDESSRLRACASMCKPFRWPTWPPFLGE